MLLRRISRNPNIAFVADTSRKGGIKPWKV